MTALVEDCFIDKNRLTKYEHSKEDHHTIFGMGFPTSNPSVCFRPSSKVSVVSNFAGQTAQGYRKCLSISELLF